MADTKISALTAASVAALANELPINESGTSKKITITQLVALAQTLGLPRPKRVGSTHSVSTTACTEVTDLTLALEIGTYVFDYFIRARSATVTVSPMFNLNFTGTAVGNWWFEYADASATLLAAIGTMDDIGVTTLGFAMRMADRTFATTAAGRMGNTGAANAVSATATDILLKITGLLTVTVAGNLALWHGSETATATSVEVGSSLVVVRTA